MRQHELAAKYIDSLLPDGASSGITDDIKNEIESHIEDRIDHYIEIGFDEDTAEKKAVSEMGDASDIKLKFTKLYRTDKIWIFLFPALYALLSFATLMLGFIYISVDSGDDPTGITFFISSLITLSIPLSMYAAYKKQNTSFLLSAGITCVAADLLWLFTAGMYQPFLVGIAFMLPLSTELGLDYLLGVFGSIVLNILFAVLAFVWIHNCKQNKIHRTAPKKKAHHMTVKKLAVIFSAISIISTGLFISQYGILSESNFMSGVIIEKVNKSTAEKCNSKIDNSMSFYEAKAFLLQNGYIVSADQEMDYSFYSAGVDGADDSQNIEYLPVIFGPADGTGCNNIFVLSDTGNKPIVYKELNYGLTDNLIALGTVKDIKPYKFYDSLDNVEIGMSKKELLKTIDTDNANIYYLWTEYKEDATYEYYTYSSTYSLGGNIKENYYVDVFAQFVFKNDVFAAMELSGFGEDEHYNYDEVGNRTLGDTELLK